MEYLENEHAFEELQETRANDVNEIVEPNKCEPALGMLFDNHEEMFAFYKDYGKQEGFYVKVRSTKKGTDGIVKYTTFACGRRGKSESKSANALKPKPNVKNGCDAKIGGIRIAQNFNSIVVGADGYENVPFLENDCRNFVDKTRRLQLEEGDAMTLLKYFQKKQAECNGFFFSIDLDEEDRLKNVFWADSWSRAAYKYFGDVITFDSTYLTNKYDMPFAPFVGVNHHGQSILLGCGLISREDTETFTWLFEAWLSCMSDSPPLGIITDQDRAMQKAIENVFPTSRHRWCLWHIMKKVPEKLGAFKEREGMSTTQRSESMNAFFDGFVNSKTNLKQFVKQYENALRRKAELEWQADAKCFSKRTPCVSRYEMKTQVEEVYTISKFKEFQEELTALMYCDISDSVGSIYQIIESFGQGRRGFFENLTIQQERYEKMCNAFSEVADVASDDENSYKTVLDWIEKAMKDLPKQIRCESVGKTNTSGASCSSNKQINSEIVERTVIGEDLQQTAPSSYHMPNEISTQGSNIATVPMYQSQFGGSNIYQPFPYNWHTQPVPPYTSQLHYSSPSMTYQGSQSENFQQLLQQQQCNEDNNDDT
ncbi:protein FAR1-RELATED SEQUENCE [Citrus sinensis]|uniref:Protein FAR1-RELATED SEQUENCE n=1 Tax=Citrus sinensis TaxID=2711 RepID=A0ACB8N940_CITSI|nr:protein FAR1-RELATED SEQUENCE [Citrus sinensis]